MGKNNITQLPLRREKNSIAASMKGVNIDAILERKFRLGDIMSAIVCNFSNLLEDVGVSSESFFYLYDESDLVYEKMIDCLEFAINAKIGQLGFSGININLPEGTITLEDSRKNLFTCNIELQKNKWNENMINISFILQETGEEIFSFIGGEFTPNNISNE